MKRLDKNQKIVLGILKRLGGKWSHGCETFGSDVRTEKVLESLACSKLVQRVGEHRNYGVFVLTPTGTQALSAI